MTWRRFLVLVRGLGPESATVAAMTSRIQFGTAEDRQPAIQDPQQAQDAFMTLFGPPPASA